MAEKKKPKSVDEIVSDYQKFHHATGKGFKDRIKKFEEFHDPESIHAQQFALHARYAVFGKPSDTKGFPGAYNEAYKVLDKHLTDDGDKLDDEDKLAQILETYADTFLQKAMGEGFKKMVEHAEKEEKLSKKDLREFKGSLLSQYLRDEQGRSTNILADNYIKGLKGKKKVDLISHLHALGEKTQKGYTIHLHSKALEGLLRDEDRLDMAKYIKPIFEEKGWKHKYAHITRSVEDQANHYALLMSGAGNELKEQGYKVFKAKKEEKK